MVANVFHAKVPPVALGHAKPISYKRPVAMAFPGSLLSSRHIWPLEPIRTAKKPNAQRLYSKRLVRPATTTATATTTTAETATKMRQQDKKTTNASPQVFHLKLRASRPRRHAGNLYLCSRVRTYVCALCFPLLARAAAFAPAADHLISPPSPHICCPLTHLPAVQSATLPIAPCQVVGFPRHGASASRCFSVRHARLVMNSLMFNLTPLSSRSQPSLLGSHHAATCLPPLICLAVSPSASTPSEQPPPPHAPTPHTPSRLLHLELVSKLFSHHSSPALPLLYLYSMHRP